MSDSITTIIFDFDGVLADYDVPVRLDYLAGLAGQDADTVLDRIWTSGFEDAADAGQTGDAAQYLKEFGERLGVPLSRDQWIAARAAAMQHRPDMHAFLEHLKPSYKLAMLTNNGPLALACFHELAPETAEFFGDTAFFSCTFNTKKPDPRIFRDVAARLASDPGVCIYVDDKQRHCDGATTAGMHAILFTGTDDLKAKLAALGVKTAR